MNKIIVVGSASSDRAKLVMALLEMIPEGQTCLIVGSEDGVNQNDYVAGVLEFSDMYFPIKHRQDYVIEIPTVTYLHRDYNAEKQKRDQDKLRRKFSNRKR